MTKEDHEDSKILEFQNEDVLIIDLCYVINDDPTNLDSSGMTKYITKSNFYGDLCYEIFDKDSKKLIDKFYTNIGMIFVSSLDEVKKFLNQEIEDWIEEYPCRATILRNYTGKIQIKTGYDKKNHKFYRYIEGEGSINFIGKQIKF